MASTKAPLAALSDGCQITDVRVHLFKEPKNRVMAFADIVIGDVFVVRQLRVVDGVNGPFVAYPRYRSGDEYRDLAHTLTAESRAMVQAIVLEKYEELLAKRFDEESGF